MVRERYHPYLAFHCWTSQPKSASTPRFFHSITGFALGGLSWPRSQHHLLLHQRRAAHHHLRLAPLQRKGKPLLHQRSKLLLHQAPLQGKGKPLLRQRRAVPHHLQKSVRDQRPKERNQSQKAAKNLRQNADHLLQRDRKVNQNLAQPRRRKSAAACELNWGLENPKFQMMEIDIRTKSVGHQQEQSWMIWKILGLKNQRSSLTNVRCAVRFYKSQNQSVTDTRYNAHTPNAGTQI